MHTISVRVPLVDGSEYAPSTPEYTSGKDFINQTISDDWGAPPRHLLIEGTTTRGRELRIVIPYSTNEPIYVYVDGEAI
jgi:hypothetical protein